MEPQIFSFAIGGRGGTQSGTFDRKYADLRFYNLVERTSKGKYRFTESCKTIKEGDYPKKVSEAKICAFLNPKVFREIYLHYRGTTFEFNKIVVENIANLLKVKIEYAEDLVAVFESSGIFAGVVSKDNGKKISVKNVDELLRNCNFDLESIDSLKEVETAGKPSKPRPKAISEDTIETEIPLGANSTGVSLSINLNLDGSMSPDVLDRVLVFLENKGIPEVSKERLDLYVTIQPNVRELLNAVTTILNDAKEEVVIVSPYLDHQVLDVIIKRANEGLSVILITRSLGQVKGKAPQEALKMVRSNPAIEHWEYGQFHSRMIITDNKLVLVSSADITHDSLVAQFNAGILTNRKDIVSKSLEFVSQLKKRAKKTREEVNNPN
jgi:hypothetical protein